MKWISLLVFVCAWNIVLSEDDELPECIPLILAHRGASGYVPEHTLGAYALAVTMGADYIEPDLVMTKDGHLIARHDNELGLTTNVEDHPEFTNRYRSQSVDGTTITGWFTEDFTLEEIKTLRAIERIPANRPGNQRMDGTFHIPTFEEIINLAKAMEVSEGRRIGLIPEIKHSTHFVNLNLAMEQPLVNILNANGYRGADAYVIIQSFEVNNLRRLRSLTDVKLLQLYSSNRNAQPFDQVQEGTQLTYGDMATAEGLLQVATYANIVGPDRSYVISRLSNNSLGSPSTFVEDAHQAGLHVHPYTFRAENRFLPEEFRSDGPIASGLGDLKGELRAFLDAGVDGLFLDQPDIGFKLRGPCKSSSTDLKTSYTFIPLVLTIAFAIKLLLKNNTEH